MKGQRFGIMGLWHCTKSIAFQSEVKNPLWQKNRQDTDIVHHLSANIALVGEAIMLAMNIAACCNNEMQHATYYN